MQSLLMLFTCVLQVNFSLQLLEEWTMYSDGKHPKTFTSNVNLMAFASNGVHI